MCAYRTRPWPRCGTSSLRVQAATGIGALCIHKDENVVAEADKYILQRNNHSLRETTRHDTRTQYKHHSNQKSLAFSTLSSHTCSLTSERLFDVSSQRRSPQAPERDNELEYINAEGSVIGMKFQRKHKHTVCSTTFLACLL